MKWAPRPQLCLQFLKFVSIAPLPLLSRFRGYWQIRMCGLHVFKPLSKCYILRLPTHFFFFFFMGGPSPLIGQQRTPSWPRTLRESGPGLSNDLWPDFYSSPQEWGSMSVTRTVKVCGCVLLRRSVRISLRANKEVRGSVHIVSGKV